MPHIQPAPWDGRESIPEAVFEADRRGRIVYANSYALESFGYASTDVSSGGLNCLDLVVAEDRARAIKHFAGVLRRGGHGAGQLRVLRGDGSVAHTFIKSMPISLEGGAVTGLMGVAVDVSEISLRHEALEAELRAAHARWRTYLAMMQSIVGLQARAVQDDAHRQCLMGIENRVRALRLIHDFRPDASTRVNARGYFEALAVQVFRSLAPDNADIRLATEIPSIEIDESVAASLGIILSELIGNALKHAFSSGSRGTITVAFMRDRAGYALSVSDDGAGLGPTPASPMGGLGMKIVRSLALEVGGEVTSAPGLSGQGTSVSVRVPAVAL
jgi:PAS domain S-box-containing protein